MLTIIRLAEIKHPVRDIVGLKQLADGNTATGAGSGSPLQFHQLCTETRIHFAGRDLVHQNVVRGEFECEALHRHAQAGLRDRIGGDSGMGCVGGPAADKDDAAGQLFLHHALGGRAREEKRSGQIDVQRAFPNRIRRRQSHRRFHDPGVANDQRRRAQIAFDSREPCLDRGRLGHVTPGIMKSGHDLPGDCGGPQIAQGDVRPGGAQAMCDRPADVAEAAADDGDLARQFEFTSRRCFHLCETNVGGLLVQRDVF